MCYGRSEAENGRGLGSILVGQRAKDEKDGEPTESGPERCGCGTSKTCVRAEVALKVPKMDACFVAMSV